MRNYVLIGAMSAVFVVLSLAIYQFKTKSNPTTQFQQTQEKRILGVQLKRSAPFSTATIQIGDQGTIFYEAEAPKAGVNNQVDSITITNQQFKELSELITKNNFWSFDESYEDVDLMDVTSNTISVSSVSLNQPAELVDAMVYSVTCRGNCPVEIIEIINKIEELWGKEILEIGV